jgi:hypothetical protein
MTSRTTRKTTSAEKPKAPAAAKVTGRGKAATAPTPDAAAAAPKTRKTSNSSKPAATPEPAATPVARAGKAAAKPAAATPAAAKAGIDATRRHQLTCEIAYGLYVARGYIGGRDLSDWLQAEAEVDRMLAKSAPEKSGGTD